jgi:hypothetical protein
MKTITILMSLMISTLSFAGTGHGHSHSHGNSHSHGTPKEVKKIDAEKAEKLARNKVRVLAFQEKVDASWNDAKLTSADIKETKGVKEWLLTFSNEKGKKGKTLYVFLKLNGEFVAANFTGK